MMTKIFLRKKLGDRIANGHPWIFSNELGDQQGIPQAGELVEVYSYNGSFIGKGFYNPQSKIRIRLFSADKNEVINDNFFYHKLSQCWLLRQKVGLTKNCRLVFSEADGLSGLIIDKFDDYFVVQTTSLAIDQWKQSVVAALEKIFNPKGIFERNDVPVRSIEGLPQQIGFLSEKFNTEILLNENQLQFHVNIATHQKTGYYLDRICIRRSLEYVVNGASVLDAFCYTGSFALHAAHYGAKSVLGFDNSDGAIATARQNAATNQFQDICTFQVANAFEILKQWGNESRQFDVIILDPPSFTISREGLEKALIGYKEINMRAMRLLKPGGFLLTGSSTGVMEEEIFIRTLEKAAKDARCTLKEIAKFCQSADHPVIWSMPHTNYLKFFLLEVNK